MPQWPITLLDQMVRTLENSVDRPTDQVVLASKGARRPSAKEERLRLFVIAEHLLDVASRNGLTTPSKPKFQELGGGNTALFVAVTTSAFNFVFKADNDSKLVREARTLELFRSDQRLGSFRHHLPRIYAVHDEEAPYAYLMEFFDPSTYPSIKQVFFDRTRFQQPPSPSHAAEIVRFVTGTLASAYQMSLDRRQQIRMLGEAYLERIDKSLTVAAGLDNRFVSQRLVVNGLDVRPWNEALALLRHASDKLQRLAPPFVTMVHGDPNPGNVLVKRDGDQVVDVKFIDVKDWGSGDYIFDFAKLTHFISHTGPIEELQAFDALTVHSTSTGMSIAYTLRLEDYLKSAVTAAEIEAERLAQAVDDPSWRARYQLALAANLLGLVSGRISSNDAPEPLLLYAEGMACFEGFLRENFAGDVIL